MILEVSPRPSKILLLITSLAAVAALLALQQTALHWPLWLALVFAALVTTGYHSLWLLGLTPRSIQQARFDRGNWQLTLADGRSVPCRLQNPVVVLPFFVSAQFVAQRERFGLAVAVDALKSDEFRRLRVLLRHSHLQPDAR